MKHLSEVLVADSPAFCGGERVARLDAAAHATHRAVLADRHVVAPTSALRRHQPRQPERERIAIEDKCLGLYGASP